MKFNKNDESISLKKYDFKGEIIDNKIEDLLKYHNLKSCTLFKFDITDEDILVFYSLSNLKSISFEFCNFKVEKLLLSPLVEHSYFTMCENLNLKSFNNTQLKQITFVGNRDKEEVLDILEFGILYNTEELIIHNYNIKNLKEIINIAPKLKKLDIDGCVLDDDECLQELMKKIEISHKEIFFYE